MKCFFLFFFFATEKKTEKFELKKVRFIFLGSVGIKSCYTRTHDYLQVLSFHKYFSLLILAT